jgi:hypothetical protein
MVEGGTNVDWRWHKLFCMLWMCTWWDERHAKVQTARVLRAKLCTDKELED